MPSRRWSLALPVLSVGALLLPAATRGALPPAPVPADNPSTAAKVELGRRLFHDADLSADGTMSCATCHEQRHAFADGNRTHPGVTGEPGRRNVPGLANVAWMSPLTFADDKARTLEAQVAIPLFGTHPVEMGMAGRGGEIPARLGRDACYVRQFARAFPESGGRIDTANVARALAAFERTMVSLDSPWDRGALSPPARAGAATFARDCAACHSGPLFTDLAHHRIEPARPRPAPRPIPACSRAPGARRTGAACARPRCATSRSPALGGTMAQPPRWKPPSPATAAPIRPTKPRASSLSSTRCPTPALPPARTSRCLTGPAVAASRS